MLCLQPAWLLRTSSVKKKKFEHLGDAQGLAGKNTKTKSQIGPWLKSTAKHNIHSMSSHLYEKRKHETTMPASFADSRAS
jgi:hypothetical protein